MAEDINMNEFSLIADAAYVYVEKSDGSQGKIRKNDFMALIKTELGYSYLKNNPNNEIEDCNAIANYSNNGLYNVGEQTLNRPSNSNHRAILLVLSKNGYYYQEYIEVTTGKRYYRYYTNSWSSWESINIT